MACKRSGVQFPVAPQKVETASGIPGAVLRFPAIPQVNAAIRDWWARLPTV